MKIKILLLFTISVNVFSLELTGTVWGPEKGGHGYYLVFITEKNFEYDYGGEGGGQEVKGTYVKKENVITLVPETIEGEEVLPDYIKQKSIICEIIETNSLFAQYKLVGDRGFELWSYNLKPNNGDKRTLNGLIVYALQVNGKVADNARVREGPGLQFKYYSFSFADFEEIHYSLPKGYSVSVLGYSESMTIVDGLEKPWYYCVFRKNMWEQQYGWIWGGIIDLD